MDLFNSYRNPFLEEEEEGEEEESLDSTKPSDGDEDDILKDLPEEEVSWDER
jgi:hypothetical protein